MVDCGQRGRCLHPVLLVFRRYREERSACVNYKIIRCCFGPAAGAGGLLCSGRAHCPARVNLGNVVPRRQVAHGPTGFSARRLSVGFVSPDSISITANGTRSRVRSQCRHRIVVRRSSRYRSGVQPPAFGTVDV
jgi:hypothetical protein